MKPINFGDLMWVVGLICATTVDSWVWVFWIAYAFFGLWLSHKTNNPS